MAGKKGVRMNRSVAIDGDKLSKELKKRNLKQKKVSSEMGYQSDVIAKAITRNRIAPQTVHMLEIMYHINKDDIMPTPESEEQIEEVKETKPTITLTEEDLQAIIFQAVKDAIQESRNVFASAMYEAINQ